MGKHLNKNELIAFARKGNLKPQERERIEGHLASCEKCQEAVEETQVLAKRVCRIREEGERRIPDNVLARIEEFAEDPLKAKLHHLVSELHGPSVLKELKDLPGLIQERLGAERLPLAAGGSRIKGDLMDGQGARLGDLFLGVEVPPKISRGMLNFAFSVPGMAGSPAAISVELPSTRVALFAGRIGEGGVILRKMELHVPGPPAKDVFLPLSLLRVFVVKES